MKRRTFIGAMLAAAMVPFVRPTRAAVPRRVSPRLSIAKLNEMDWEDIQQRLGPRHLVYCGPKRCLSTAEFDNPNNWIPCKTPRSRDSLVFPDGVVVRIPFDERVYESITVSHVSITVSHVSITVSHVSIEEGLSRC